jgi:hypothetical protein
MYLFGKDKVAVLHLNKTAGSTVRLYFVDVLQRNVPKYKILKPEHGFLCNKYHLIPKDYKIIATVRNPYARMVSLYYFRKGKNVPGMPYWEKRSQNAINMDFKTWFLKDFLPDFKAGDMHTQPLYKGIEVKGKIPENVFIAKVETLQEDIDRFLNTLGIVTDKKLPVANATKHKPWQECYDDEMRNMVYEWDRKTFETFGYDKQIGE